MKIYFVYSQGIWQENAFVMKIKPIVLSRLLEGFHIQKLVFFSPSWSIIMPYTICKQNIMHYFQIQTAILTRYRVKKKLWKHQKSWWFLTSSLYFTGLIIKVKQIVLFKEFSQLNFLKGKKMFKKIVRVILVPRIKFFPTVNFL